MNKAEKLQMVEKVGTVLDKQFQTTNTFQNYAAKVNQIIPSIPTSLPTFDDEVFRCGGFPRGRVIEVYGPESSGKTAICLHTIGECQRADGVAAFIDAEHALDPTFASILGVDMDELVISQPNCGEEALEIVEALVGVVDLIVVDSVTALVPRAELDGEMGDSFMGLQARLMSQAMRKLCGKVAKSQTCVIFINQIREKVGVVFGNPEVTTGGRALKFYASLRVEIRRVSGKDGFLKEGDTIVGHRMKAKAQKNKVGSPFHEGEVDLYYGSGFDKRGDTLEYARRNGLVTGTAWLVLADDPKGEKFRRDDLLSDEHYLQLLASVEKFRKGK